MISLFSAYPLIVVLAASPQSASHTPPGLGFINQIHDFLLNYSGTENTARLRDAVPALIAEKKGENVGAIAAALTPMTAPAIPVIR